MHLLRFFIFITTLLFIPYTAFASIIWLPEETPSLRRNNLCLTDKQYQQFENAKNFYYKELLPDLPISQEIPFFELFHPISKQKIFMLGTYHDLPFECLPKWFQPFVETQMDEVYLESEWATMLANLGKSTDISEHIDPALQEELSNFSTPILSVFSKQVGNLNLEELHLIIRNLDALFGMDATIEILSLKNKIPLFMLDRRMDKVKSTLFFYKESLKYDLHSAVTPEKKAHIESLLESSNEKLMITCIKEDLRNLRETYSDKAELTQSVKELLIEWSKEPVAYKGLEEIVDFTNAQVLERNERWVKLLNSTSPSKKLVAVGAGHLLDLFERFRALGYEIKSYKPE
ncbi:MAG: hypothetical protein BGO76_02975 [Caedibacter sp. 38-128]|nr:hypothetical protein [Holosporales bacterium]OJX07095.1 MAG: hypothetical protein BGO76_02975 [Caedibacter sp. 38-128]